MQNQQIQAELAELRAMLQAQNQELSELRANLKALAPAVTFTPSSTSDKRSSRRRLLRTLAAGLLGGVGLVGTGSLPTAQAKFTLRSRAGAIIVSDATVVSGSLAASVDYGLIVSSRATLDLGSFVPRQVGSYGEGTDFGLYGYSYGVNGPNPDRAGVYGVGIGDTNSGVAGYATGPYAKGVVGVSQGDNSSGVLGSSSGTGSRAGYFVGPVEVIGPINKAGGSFKIDHPLEPAQKYLSHSFVESPDMKNIYDGVVTLDEGGKAEIALPDWFEALNSDYRYQLTCLGQFSPVYIATEIENSRFSIGGGQPGQKISWQLSGIRQDSWAKANRVEVEETKGVQEQGYYLHPEVFGYGEDKSIASLFGTNAFKAARVNNKNGS